MTSTPVDLSEPGLLCPSCRVPLVMTDRKNVEIDYCPKCRGVWLDRGELDKIIERSLREVVPAAAQTGPEPVNSRDQGGHGESRGHGSSHGGSKHGVSASGGYRRKSWLQELFD